MPNSPKRYDALLLAGGEGRRMDGRDKGLVPWRGQPLFAHALGRLRQQTVPPQQLWISANRNTADYGASGYPVLADRRAGFSGPLAGMEAGLNASAADWLLCVPCDTPLLPLDLAAGLLAAVGDGVLAAYAVTDAAPQPVCCVLSRTLLPNLTETLTRAHGRVLGWLNAVHAVPVRFADTAAFTNLNTLAALGGELDIPQ